MSERKNYNRIIGVLGPQALDIATKAEKRHFLTQNSERRCVKIKK